MKKTLVIVGIATLFLGPQAQPLQADLVASFQDFSAVRAYPNPWKINQHGAIPITFDHLPDGFVSTVKIYTISGELVRTLSGTQTLRWDMRNDGGQNVASGIYLYLLTAGSSHKTGKVVVIR